MAHRRSLAIAMQSYASNNGRRLNDNCLHTDDGQIVTGVNVIRIPLQGQLEVLLGLVDDC